LGFSARYQIINEEDSDEIGKGIKNPEIVTFHDESAMLQAAGTTSKKMQISTGSPSPLDDIATPCMTPEK
jgi:hypothetical protein